MYDIYLDRMLIPINPEKISIKSKNKNELIELINSSELNLLKSEGLKDISFSFSIPAFKYPFRNTLSSWHNPNYYIDKLKRLKANRKPFQFIITRRYPTGKSYFNTNIKVSLESYEISDNADDFMDVTIDVELKEYRPLKTTTLDLLQDKVSAYVTVPREVTKILDQVVTTKEGELLWNVVRKRMGGVEKMAEVMTLNGLKHASDFVGGMVLKLP